MIQPSYQRYHAIALEGVTTEHAPQVVRRVFFFLPSFHTFLWLGAICQSGDEIRRAYSSETIDSLPITAPCPECPGDETHCRGRAGRIDLDSCGIGIDPLWFCYSFAILLQSGSFPI